MFSDARALLLGLCVTQVSDMVYAWGRPIEQMLLEIWRTAYEERIRAPTATSMPVSFGKLVESDEKRARNGFGAGACTREAASRCAPSCGTTELGEYWSHGDVLNRGLCTGGATPQAPEVGSHMDCAVESSWDGGPCGHGRGYSTKSACAGAYL